MSRIKNALENVPKELLSKTGTISLDEVKKNDYIGLYFASRWAPPCRKFTPILSDAYTKMRNADHKIEIIFVSYDTDEEQFEVHYGIMPFLAAKFGFDTKDSLIDDLSVEGIPTLVICNNEGKIIENNALQTIMEYKEKSYEHWKI